MCVGRGLQRYLPLWTMGRRVAEWLIWLGFCGLQWMLWERWTRTRLKD